MKKLLITIAAFAALVGIGVFAANSLQANALYTTRNCGTSAVIKCGTMNDAELKAGLKKSASARALFKHLGVSQTLSGSKKGTLKTNGDIVVGGTVVAKNAQSYGRTHRPGSKTVTVGSTKFYSHPAKTAFPDSTPVHVFFDKYGRFVNAIADVCGNPIIATPTKPKPSFVCNYLKAAPINGSRTNFKFTANSVAKNGAKKTKYVFSFGDGKSTTVNTNKETVSVNHNYAKAGSYTATVKVHSNFTTVSCTVKLTVKPAPPAPAASCDSLSAKSLNRTKHQFAAKATAKNGAKITGYTFNFGDGTSKKQSSSTITHTYATPGTYTVKVTAHTSAGDKTSAACTTKVTVKPAPAAACTGLTATIAKRTNVSLRASASATNGATIKSYDFVIVDSNNKSVYSHRVTSSATSAQATTSLEAGDYTAKVTVNTSEGAKTNSNCEAAFTINREKVPGVAITKLVDGVKSKRVNENKPFTYQVKVTNTGETTLKDLAVTDTPPNGVILIESEKGEINDNIWTYTIPELGVGQSASFELTAKAPKAIAGTLTNKVCVDTPSIPGSPDDCDTADVELFCPIPGKVNLPVDSPDCKEVPVTPPEKPQPKPPVTELPQTGANDAIVGGIGVASLIAGIGYYVASRRSL